MLDFLGYIIAEYLPVLYHQQAIFEFFEMKLLDNHHTGQLLIIDKVQYMIFQPVIGNKLCSLKIIHAIFNSLHNFAGNFFLPYERNES